MKVEVAVLGSPSSNRAYGLCERKATLNLLSVRAQELCESRGGRPGLPVLNSNSPYGLCGRNATLNQLLAAATRRPSRFSDRS